MPPKRGQNTGLNQLQQYIYLDMILLSSQFLLASFGPFSESEMSEKDQDAKEFRVSVTYGSDGPYITCHTVQAGGHNGSILHSVSTEQLLSHFIYLKHSGDCLKLCWLHLLIAWSIRFIAWIFRRPARASEARDAGYDWETFAGSRPWGPTTKARGNFHQPTCQTIETWNINAKNISHEDQQHKGRGHLCSIRNIDNRHGAQAFGSLCSMLILEFIFLNHIHSNFVCV